MDRPAALALLLTLALAAAVYAVFFHTARRLALHGY